MMVVKSTENKTPSSLIDLLGGGVKNKTAKTTDTFAQLLASLNIPVKGEKSFGAMVDPKAPKSNETVTLSTKTVEDPLSDEETKMIPNDMVTVLSNDQVRTLIQKAKEYLKNEITAKAPEYKIDVKALPKTLMGLVEMANKIGIDMSSITLSTLDDSTKTLSKELPASLLSKSVIELKKSPQTETSATPKTLDVMTQLLTQTKGMQTEPMPIKAAVQPLQSLLKELAKTADIPVQPVPAQAGSVQPVPAQAVPVQPVPTQAVPVQPVPTQAVPVQPVPTQAVPVQPVPAQAVPVQPVPTQAVPVQPVPTQAVPVQPVPTQAVPVQPVPAQAVPVQPVPAQAVPVQPVPAQAVPVQPVPTQAVPTMAEQEILKQIPKTATITSTDVLRTLLRGNNDVEKLEKIKEKSPSGEESPKLPQVHTEGSLEVKSKEAVQSLRHFSTDLKEAAENYKPPFTRITMKLNPEKLGEVEVTLVQRGNNIHVNIQSANASSVAFLAHNAMELRTQLTAQGVMNSTMNFMSGGENQSQNPNPQQQQQQQNRFQAYKSLSELESSGEQLSALEIILPHYA
ncbi:MAG: flagellar hook-length control protein FliK [Campylobacterales bacterium]|nr:flagellar hook-length control protein FliK [Campylobacterales bacterium]